MATNKISTTAMGKADKNKGKKSNKFWLAKHASPVSRD